MAKGLDKAHLNKQWIAGRLSADKSLDRLGGPDNDSGMKRIEAVAEGGDWSYTHTMRTIQSFEGE
jgi:hypothetical protein